MAAPPRLFSRTDPSGLVNTTKSPRLITKPKEARVSTAFFLCHKLGREGGARQECGRFASSIAGEVLNKSSQRKLGVLIISVYLLLARSLPFPRSSWACTLLRVRSIIVYHRVNPERMEDRTETTTKLQSELMLAFSPRV